jgi:hypothetical protein
MQLSNKCPKCGSKHTKIINSIGAACGNEYIQNCYISNDCENFSIDLIVCLDCKNN